MPKGRNTKVACGVKGRKRGKQTNGMGKAKPSNEVKKGIESNRLKGKRIQRNTRKSVCQMDDFEDFDDLCSESSDSNSDTDTDSDLNTDIYTEQSISESKLKLPKESNGGILQEKRIMHKNGNNKNDIGQCPNQKFAIDFSDNSGFSYDDDSISCDSDSEFGDSKHVKKSRHNYSSTSHSDAFHLPKKLSIKKRNGKHDKSVKLSRRMSYKLARPQSQSSPPPSPITATRLSFSPNRKSSVNRTIKGKKTCVSKTQTRVRKKRRH